MQENIPNLKKYTLIFRVKGHDVCSLPSNGSRKRKRRGEKRDGVGKKERTGERGRVKKGKEREQERTHGVKTLIISESGERLCGCSL